MVPYLERYLQERTAYLRERGIAKSVPLFPNLRSGPDEFYSSNAFYIIKHDVELASGVDFKLKDFRSTLTSITVNGDMSLLPAMSAQLRHKTVGQTQQPYYRMEQGAAGRQLKNAWKNSPTKLHGNPLLTPNTNHLGIIRVDRAGFLFTKHTGSNPF